MSPADKPSWKRRIIRLSLKLVLLGVSLGVGLLVAEGVVRWFAPQQLIILRNDVWKAAPVFGHRHREHADTTINTGEGTVRFVTDGDGLRISQPAADADAQFSVLALGDSFLEAIQVENESTMVEVLRRNLEAKSQSTVHVDNAGVGMWNPNHYYLEAQRALSSRDYDLGLVFIYLGNDVIQEEVEFYEPRERTVRHSLRWPRPFERSELIQAVLYPINDILETRSHLFILFRKSMRVPLARLGLTPLTFPSEFTVAGASGLDWETTAKVCEKIQGAFQDRETPVLFVLLPTPFQVHDDMLADYLSSFGIEPTSVDLELPNRMLASEFQKRRLKFVDVLPAMQAQSGQMRMYGSVDQHFNENGHRVVAETIEPLAAAELGVD